MTEEIMTTDTTVDETQKYIDTINQLKANSVSRSDYDKIRDENKKLLEAIVQGNSVETSSTEEAAKPSIQDLRNKAYGKGAENLTDLEYVSTVLDLRDALLEEEGIDHMIPAGKKYSPDLNDQHCAQKAYEALRHCVDVADGDNEVFIQEITRITVDNGLPINKNLQNRNRR